MPWQRTAPVDDACTGRLRERARERIASRIEHERRERRAAALSHVRGLDSDTSVDDWCADLRQEARESGALDEEVRSG